MRAMNVAMDGIMAKVSKHSYQYRFLLESRFQGNLQFYQIRICTKIQKIFDHFLRVLQSGLLYFQKVCAHYHLIQILITRIFAISTIIRVFLRIGCCGVSKGPRHHAISFVFKTKVKIINVLTSRLHLGLVVYYYINQLDSTVERYRQTPRWQIHWNE